MALVVASPDHPAFGALVPVWEDVVSTGIEDTPVDMLMAYPNAPLDPDTDYAVAITGTLRDVDGAPVPRERASDVALGLADPETREEADIAGYYAPTRAALEAAGLEMGDLSRIWEFTTRSREDPLKRLWTAMELADEALNAGEIEVEIFAAAEDSDERVLRIVRGYLKDLPSFFDEDGYLVLDDQGYPQLTRGRASRKCVSWPIQGIDGS